MRFALLVRFAPVYGFMVYYFGVWLTKLQKISESCQKFLILHSEISKPTPPGGVIDADEDCETIVSLHLEEFPAAVRDDFFHRAFHRAHAVSLEKYR